MNYTISMTDILLAVSVGCNLWFLFLLLYERIMDTRIVRWCARKGNLTNVALASDWASV